jgi:hypothetical protein
LFLGIIKHYCQANNIDISAEPNIGRGPVDFKASKGFNLRVLLELKLARNSKFWNGAEKQLPAYLKAERVKDGFFIVVAYNEADVRRVRSIKRIVKAVRESTQVAIRPIVVDASLEKPSASKL